MAFVRVRVRKRRKVGQLVGAVRDDGVVYITASRVYTSHFDTTVAGTGAVVVVGSKKAPVIDIGVD